MLKSRFKNVISVLLALSMSSMTLSSCNKGDGEFPTLEYPENETTTTVETTASEEPVELTEISIASPYSATTIDLLARLYYAKCNDLIPDDQSGADISIDFLQNIDMPWIVDARLTSSDGAGIQGLMQWDEEDTMPDLVLVEDISSAVETGLIVPYDEYLSTNDLVNGNSMYPETLLYSVQDGQTYGLPFYETVMLLVGNREYIPDSGILPFRSDIDEFEDYLQDIDDQYGDGDIVVLAGGYELLPYLSSSFNGDNRTSYMFLDEPELTSNLDSSVDYIEDLYDMGLTRDTDPSGADPRIARTACIWVTSSGNIDLWNEYYPDSLYYSMIPSASGESTGIPYATVYSLCLTESCADKAFASDFAAFMCFDVDAQMLLYRLEPQRGYLPCLNSSGLWDIVCDDTVFGTEAMLFEQMMSRAVYCPGSSTALHASVDSYNMEYFASYLNGEYPEYDQERLLP